MSTLDRSDIDSVMTGQLVPLLPSADPAWDAAIADAAADDGSVSHVVRFSKNAGRQLADDKLRQQIDTVVASVNTAQRMTRGWKVEVEPWHKFRPYGRTGDAVACGDCGLARAAHRDNWFMREYVHDSSSTGHYTYHVNLQVACKPERKRPTMHSEFENILAALASRGRGFSGEDWKVSLVDSLVYTAKSPTEISDDQALAAEIGYAPFDMPTDVRWREFFTDLYGLDDQIELVKRAIEAALKSNWQGRYNCVLVGPPGCGKSNICQLIKRAVGDEAVLEFDGTSTTMAGAQKELGEREELPRLLLIEEIEKAPEASLAWLLSLTDIRAEVRKTTARGNIMRDVKMLAICTVNDMDTFQHVAFGALKSRFPNIIGFQRPSREIRARILEREIKKVQDGNMAWIEPAIDFAEDLDSDDPRELIAICMIGREKLLDGTYQLMRLRTMPDGTDRRALADRLNKRAAQTIDAVTLAPTVEYAF